MDPIEKIIDRLKKEYGESEGSYILDLFYKEEFKNHFLTGQGYQNITGFLYGLQATNFITLAEVFLMSFESANATDPVKSAFF